VTRDELIKEIRSVFSTDLVALPARTLRAGNAYDEHLPEPPFDPKMDIPTEDYLEKYHWGVCHLDPLSWRHYLPALLEYSLKNMAEDDMTIEATLRSLRPPDRTPPRLASLSGAQEAVIASFLETLAFDAHSAHQDFARQVLEEWWIPGALYRPGIT